MKKTSSQLITYLVILLSLAACSSANEPVIPVTVTASPQPTSTPLPTPSSPSDSIIWQNLQVTVGQTEITNEFVTEFGSTRNPSPGTKFMWMHVQLKNLGQVQVDIPLPENFSVLYAAAEIKPTYGHRQGYQDYSTLTPILFPAQATDGWLRFDIPATAELKDLLCVFLPESSQIGTTFSSPSYPYSEDKPTFVWKCAP